MDCLIRTDQKPQAAPIVANPPGQATDVRSSASSDLSDLSEEEVAPLTFKKHGESSTVGGAQLDHEPDSDDDDAMVSDTVQLLN